MSENRLASPKLNRSDVEEIARETLHKGWYRLDRFRLRHRTFAGGWSETISREVFIPGDSVVVLPYDPGRDAVVLVEQFRIAPYSHGDNPWMIETVAGRIKPGETPEDVARREAQEEAGCTLDELVRIGAHYPSPGAVDEFIHLYCGMTDSAGLGGLHGLEEEHEDIAVLVVSFAEAMAGMQSGLIVSGPLMLALQWLALYKDRFHR